MNKLKSAFKQAIVYGIATVFPRIVSVLLVRLHTDKSVLEDISDYGDLSIIFSYIILFNVLLSYGLETAFFRFFNSYSNKSNVVSTSSISIIITSVLFLILGLSFTDQISSFIGIRADYLFLVIWILVLDALVVIPFAYLRLNNKAIKYTVIKIFNVIINISLNIFFLIFLKNNDSQSPFFDQVYKESFEINYIFISLLISSALTFLVMINFYFKIQYKIDFILLKKMLKYSLPILLAGLAYSINESFDKILLDYFDVAKAQIGMYAACYKLALFITLFSTAFKLGIEPFIFSNVKNKSAQKTYALILEVFVILGSFILITVVVFIDILKLLFIGDSAYWEALYIVPIILFANLFLGIYQNLSVWYKVTDNTKFGAYISIFGAFITIILNITLINYFDMSYLGSAIATFFAYFIMATISYYLGQRHYPIPYNIRKICLYILFSSAFAFTSFYVFPGNYYFGIGILITLGLFIIKFEKNTIKLINNEN
ncbi:polysaccharide biosynthesis C-terminal domain-containing protein [Flavobacteriaceae bacterium]|nr:polysaccharide biosynthesis C-terminal domain-containing protein [Flavobacteriaceae bacterium]MDC1492181.1 polysaccharide biosynthesis C-terminal domain-containing protein [Flavobacteriaceae bacterium]